MEHTALITGASSGIGEAYAHELAKRGYNLFIVARREERLRKLKTLLESKYHVSVLYKKVDLCIASERNALCTEINAAHQLVMLVNNAGFGKLGQFDTEDRRTQLEMIELNISALVDLSHQLIGNLKKSAENIATHKYHQWSHIINIGSVAGFQSGPYMAVYYATKSFVLHFSEALEYELRKSGAHIAVSVVCPGPTKSEFGIVAGFAEDGGGHAVGAERALGGQLTDGGELALGVGRAVGEFALGTKRPAGEKTTVSTRAPNLMTKMFFSKYIPTSEALVEYSLNKILNTKQRVIVHGALFKVLNFFNRLLSRKQITNIVGRLQSKRQSKAK